MSRLRLTAMPVAAWLAALLIAGCGGGGGTASAPAGHGGDAVAIQNFAYSPATLTVPSGTRVSFANHDKTNHTATDGAMGGFDTGTISPGQTKTVTLSTAGTFSYVCSFHPFMHGTVTVEP